MTPRLTPADVDMYIRAQEAQTTVTLATPFPYRPEATMRLYRDSFQVWEYPLNLN